MINITNLIKRSSTMIIKDKVTINRMIKDTTKVVNNTSKRITSNKIIRKSMRRVTIKVKRVITVANLMSKEIRIKRKMLCLLSKITILQRNHQIDLMCLKNMNETNQSVTMAVSQSINI
jgi:hypothetical protein